jgi:hypothetical protein
MATCVKCGASLAPDAKFCQRCGTPAPAPPAVEPPVLPPPVVPASSAAAPPPPPAEPAAPRPGARPIGPGVSYTPVTAQKRSTWWIVPLVVVGLVVIAWLLLAGLPFGGREENRVETPPTETIAEGTAEPGEPMNSGTLIEVPGDEPLTTETTAPPMQTDTTGSIGLPPTATTATQAPAPPATQTQPPPRVVEEPLRTPPATQPRPQPPAAQPRPPVTRPRPQPPAQQPRPVTTPPPPVQREAPGSEISESEAAGTLSGFIRSNNSYDVSRDCLQIRSHGYRNVGYTFSVWDACVSGGGSRMLGRWRVDSKTREVFRQRDDGRYLRP